jgi:hypothetical protein
VCLLVEVLFPKVRNLATETPIIDIIFFMHVQEEFAQVVNQLVKSEIRFRRSGKIIGLARKRFWSIGTTILAQEKEI